MTSMSLSLKLVYRWIEWLAVTSSVPSHCTIMYPMALMCLMPFSGECVASLPQVLEGSFCRPLIPNPILESEDKQLFSLLPTMPILACDVRVNTLSPSLLHWSCNEAGGPISFFHVLRPTVVGRYFPSAISEYREVACLVMTMKFICWPIFIPRQILEKDVFQ